MTQRNEPHRSEQPTVPAAEPAAPPEDDAILISDLAPRRDILGGRKVLFGEEPHEPGQPQGS